MATWSLSLPKFSTFKSMTGGLDPQPTGASARAPLKDLKEFQGWKRPKGKPALVKAHVCGDSVTQHLSPHLSFYNEQCIS